MFLQKYIGRQPTKRTKKQNEIQIDTFAYMLAMLKFFGKGIFLIFAADIKCNGAVFGYICVW